MCYLVVNCVVLVVNCVILVVNCVILVVNCVILVVNCVILVVNCVVLVVNCVVLCIFFFTNATTCPLRLRDLPSIRLWLKCNRILKLGRPVGAVTLSR